MLFYQINSGRRQAISTLTLNFKLVEGYQDISTLRRFDTSKYNGTFKISFFFKIFFLFTECCAYMRVISLMCFYNIMYEIVYNRLFYWTIIPNQFLCKHIKYINRSSGTSNNYCCFGLESNNNNVLI